MTSANVESVDTTGELCKVNVKTAKGTEVTRGRGRTIC
jgi:dihydrolipoamide dehydrogenase